MVNHIQKVNKRKKHRAGDKKTMDAPVNYVNVFILLAYGYIAVLTPNLETFDSNGPKFLALAILNLLVCGYFIYREHNNKSLSVFSNFFKTKIGLAYSVFIMLSLLSFIKSINVIESIVQFSKIFTTFTATWIISIILLKDKRIIKYLAIGLAGLLVFDSIWVYYEIYHYIQGDIETIKIIKAGYSNKNILSASLFVKLPFALWLLTFKKGWLKILGLVSVFLGIIAVLFMSSRAFYLGLITLSVLYATFLAVRYYQTKNKLFLNNIASYFTSLIIALLIFSVVQKIYYPNKADIYNKSITSRLATATAEDSSAANRLKFWGWTLGLIKENPVLGVGLGNWKIVAIEHQNKTNTNNDYTLKTHNDFLEMMSETGILGGLSYVAIFIFIFLIFIKLIFRDKEDEAISYYFLPAFGLLAYSFDAFFNFPQGRPEIQSLFAIYCGAGLAFSNMFSKNIFNKNFNKSILKNNNSFLLIIISSLAILTTVYILALNFKSLKLQRIMREEIILKKDKSPSEIFLSGYPKIPNMSAVGDPIKILIAPYLIEEKRYVEAINLLKTEDLGQYYPQRDFFISFCYNKMNQPDSSLYYAKKTISIKPLYYIYTKHYCSILVSLGREREAITMLDTLLLKSKKAKEAWKYNAVLNYNIGDKQKSSRLIDSALHYFPDDTTFTKFRDHYFESLVCQEAIKQYEAKNYREAIRYFEMSEAGFEDLGGHTTYPKFLNSWALSHLNLTEIAQAKSIFKQVIKEDPKNYTALMNLGKIAFSEKKYQKAIGYFKRCIEADSPDYFLSYKNLGTVYLIHEQPDRAIESYNQALKYGSSKDIYGNLYLLWESRGNEEKAAYYKALRDKE